MALARRLVTNARMRRAIGVATFVALWIALFAPPARAHTIGLSTGEYVAKDASLVVKLAFARAEVASLAPSVDANRDGHLTPVEIDAARGVMKEKIFGRILVTSGGAPCAPSLTDAGLTEQDGLLLAGRWDCASSAQPFQVDLALVADLARGHRHVARAISGSATHDEVLSVDQRTFAVPPDATMASPSVSTQVAARSSSSVGSFLRMGFEHILSGYDHLLFIVGLVLARASRRALLAVVTAFTLGHSITLALSVMGVWAPSPRLVEPAIALSIAYVGIENLFVKDANRRWRLALPFGLVHGFGFAGVLRDLNVARSEVPAALVSFNVGVEAGQLAVLAVLLPCVFFLRDKRWFEPHGARVLSGAVALAGGIWFVARVVHG